LIGNEQTSSMPSRTRRAMKVIWYLVGKALTIAITIFIGVFITVLLVNQPSQRGLGPPVSPFETSLEAQIFLVVRASVNGGLFGQDADKEQIAAMTYLPRHLLWTIKALTFDWGKLGARQGGWASATATKAGASDIILQYLPNTLLLIGTAYLLVFLIGMPLSLYLSRNYGKRLDRLFAVLSPISSVPSWVIGILLISIFAFQLHWLPLSGMYDSFKPENPVEYILVLSKHMILPVTAIVLSLLFQVVYMWRTFFIIYSEEDYVELARAKGLLSKVLEKQYILKPALPYIITGFITSLVSFWQMSMALEAVFRWPGLGWLYIKEALPNFWGESMEPGELIIVVGIVVIFAYLLGGTVFILDFVYVIVDPRIRLMPTNDAMRTQARIKSKNTSWSARFKAWMKRRNRDYETKTRSPAKKRGFSWGTAVGNFRESLRRFGTQSGLFVQELRRYPSAMFGLAVIIILLAGSIYAVIALPYEQYGQDYDWNRLTGYSTTPRTAMPEWMNLFNDPPLLSTLILKEDSREASVSMRTLENGWVEKTTIFTFDYNYKEVPSEVFLYLDPKYSERVPFASLEWMYPDGSTLKLKDKAISASTSYDFEAGINPSQILNRNLQWKNWFVQTGLYPTPAYNLLFAEPGSSQFVLQHGTYRLTVTSLLFEKDSDIQPQLVLLGQVYGLAGTDYARRDLIVPLFWGMPFALLIGLLGTLITTLIAMILPAIGVWYGGWVDNLIQRLTEINMVLPSLPIAVLTNVLFGWNIWIILAIVVVLNTFGSPIKTLRSAFLQAKEAPYIETARSYGASDFRIITHYLVPRILPVLIPQLISQVPSFIFLEATLGFFNIKSTYPSWGRIIYEGLTRGALYGSPFWVLEPITLLLLTSLAFAMLGSALERILNPRMIDTIPVRKDETKQEAERADSPKKRFQLRFDRRVTIGLVAVMAMIVIVLIFSIGRRPTGAVVNLPDPSQAFGQTETINVLPADIRTPTLVASSPSKVSTFVPEMSSIPAPLSPTLTISLTLPPTAKMIVSESTLTPALQDNVLPAFYTLQPGEFPYCIARRFNVHPIELLTLNGLVGQQVFYTWTVLKIPQTGRPFPGNRMLQHHPATYTVTRQGETIYGVACVFGDIDPVTVAQTNNISVDSALFVGQQLTIP
jgi:peptide/nickel transport system permease protein